ncbi:MAG: PilZ domain-containing protein [Proteobacteria bacterium]|nr:PilZ domain-containing protein [Pseudomonadota bacterium]
MLEKRVHKRRHLVYYLRAVDNATGRELGRVGDISPSGILLVSKNKIALQTEYEVGIELSDLENNNQYQQLIVKIVPMWAKKDVNPDYMCIGSKFVDITEKDKLVIMDIIQSIGFLDGESLPEA